MPLINFARKTRPMKKIMHWLNTLPEPQRTQAINYCAGQNPRQLLHQVDSLKKAVSGAFDWSKTREGVDYWLAISQSKDEQGS